VDVGGVQDGDVPSLSRAYGTTLGDLVQIRAAFIHAGQDGREAQDGTHPPHTLEEVTSRGP